MKFNPLHYPALLLLCLLLGSAADNGCRRHRSDDVKPATENRPSDYLLAQLQKNTRSEVRYFSAQAKIFATGDVDPISANANIIWIKDSVLWLNVRKFGIEAVRALVTRDSVFILDRLNDTYTAQGLESLQRNYGLPGGFDLLGNLLMGSAWVPADAGQWQSGLDDGLHRLSGSNNRLTANYHLEENGWRLRHAAFLDKRDARALSLDFEQFKKLSGTPAAFPYFRRIAAYSPESGMLQLEIELSDVQINVPKPFRFEIPAHYQRL
ncbi:MAG: DUF4292 domain-containing protein [Saprospiraceae bacterium]|nr:DUF4292 domain-containing protein [Saprospiraceae bacterium]